MKMKYFISISIIFFTVSQTNCYGILDTLEGLIYSGLDKVYITPFLDILDPRNYVKTINRAGGDLVRKMATRLSLDDEVLNLANSKVPEIITYHGYPVESHMVQTEDGYRIEIHRIPPNDMYSDQRPYRGAVILAPGILCSSACWIFLGPGRALPYILADLGYDVWLANVRGNTYGRQHIIRNPNIDPSFWSFSFHEIGMYDFPAIIDYVTSATRENQVTFIAHSVSTSAFYVMCSERPEYNLKIKTHISLAPAAHMKHLSNPFLYFLSQFVGVIDKIGHLIGHDEFLPDNQLLVRLGGTLCGIKPFTSLLCANSMFVICGFNKKQMNNTLLPIIFGHTPAGTSLRVLIHYGQLVRNFRDRFQYFSHGLANPYYYGQIFPPVYNLKNITVPSYCFYGRNDWLINKKDARMTCEEIGNVKRIFEVSDEEWNHNDFVYAIHAKEEVFDYITDILEKYK